MRRKLLNAYLFKSLKEVRCLSEEWKIDNNTERPHNSLGYLSPLCFAEQQYNRSKSDMKLYPQMVNEDNLKVEENHLSEKIVGT